MTFLTWIVLHGHLCARFGRSRDFGYGITNLFVVTDGGKNANCRAPELEISADCDVQVQLLITV